MFYDYYVDLCNKKGVKPSRAATEAGVSKSAVTVWKTRGTKPNMENATKLANYFDVPVSAILDFEETEKSPSSDELDRQLEGVEFALWGEVHDLTDEEKEDILEFVKFTKSKRKNK